MDTLPKLGDSIIWCGELWKSCMEGGRLIHPDNPYQWYSEKCLRILDNQTLVLTIKKEPRKIKYWDGREFEPNYGVGTLKSDNGFSYGTFKAKIRVPRGKNLWPSFWLTCKETKENFEIMKKRGDDKGLWPKGGEIDAMECWSGEDRYLKLFIAQPPYICLSWRTTTNIHYEEDSEHKSIGSRNIPWLKQPKSPDINWIEYEVQWFPESITFKANGKVVRTDTKAAKTITEYWKSVNKKPTMSVIFNIWMEDPEKFDVSLYCDMQVKEFSYTPYRK